MKEFLEAYYYLNGISVFKESEDDGDWMRHSLVYPVLINPDTGSIDEDESKNTEVEIWIEPGFITYEKGKPINCHAWRWDCGGPTFEDAVITLASNVRKDLEGKDGC